MRPDQIATLLAYISSIDGRHTSTLMAEAWSDLVVDLDFEDAKAAVRDHCRASTDWLKPAHILTGVRQIRKKRIQDLERHLDGEVTIRRQDHGTPQQEIATRKRLLDWIASGRMTLDGYCDYHGGTHVLAANARPQPLEEGTR